MMGEDVAVIVVSLARSGLFGDLGLIGDIGPTVR